MVLYAAFVQFVHVTLDGRETLLEAISASRLVSESVPITLWILVRVSVTQLVLPSFKHATFLIVG